MKFKLDECMDVRLVVLFVNAGHNAQTVYGEGLSGEPDSEMFQKEVVRPGLLAIEQGQLYDKLFDNRQKGDYADLVKFDLAEVGKLFDETKRFVEAVTKIAKKEMEKQ
jgi:hypothetical protein